MRAMVLEKIGRPLVLHELPDPEPADHEIRLRVAVCGVCRTDLHVVDGELTQPRLPLIPGHEIVGRIDKIGRSVRNLEIGQRIGIPWLGSTCGVCSFCNRGEENLCDHPTFTGYTRDGGYATCAIADASFAVALSEKGSDVDIAPLLCAGLIGWRSLIKAGRGQTIGIYGFGAAGHIVSQVARFQGRRVFVFTRQGDTAAQDLARKLGADWVGSSDEPSPEPLDCAIIYAPVGSLVPVALKATRKGGRVVCAGIHMSDIPSFPYKDLWGEREIVSVANLTRKDAVDFFNIVERLSLTTTTTTYPLDRANEALSHLRAGRVQGAAVITFGP